ncbi:hypothetical protein AGMMS49938_02080 [Fibrobacterales bacterium]|nr:hypothetical protein AGMMS49938_02080 [Fibrobacterales bacterium]
MLDAEMKRYINNARDILVGKVPNPQSQVDLITTSLIYKFMDDMDLQGVELSGKRTFFTGDLEKYAFSKLLDPKLGNQGRLNLYAEALEKLPTAASVPELFCTIFKGAFLPFRDPATLTMFLKEINNFSYDNSESLGNAFEYLLSIMGSQGDAGQFRTPRHIIDFVVAVVKPTKEDTILDPACGTAGFLISAFKYILVQHTKTRLTPVQMKTLTNNIVGYDISPDMRKLALVNLYLHQFANPKIYEYDTLTSEERWTDKFDVILANPPFMTPKGGIIPHNKFSMKANRAEVLFVDYIMEHLTLNGRAGVIVPEGIIFNNDKTYKNLRKLLVDENYLYAVVSLPGGVFQPYSGVKTSILFMDRQIAKQKKDILFVKIENDGFDLGTQRRAIEKNDLPAALAVIEEYRGGAQAHTPNASIVPKTKIAENGEYNLTASRYVETAISNSKYEMVRLGDVANVSSGNSAPQKQSLFENGSYPFCRTADVGKIHISSNFSDVSDKLNEDGIKGLKLFSKDTILFPKSGASILLNHRVLLSIDSYVSSHLATIYRNEEKVLSKYLFYILCQIDAKDLIPDSDYPSLKISDIENIKIPLPPIAVQKKIVAEIEAEQEEIKKCKESIKSHEAKIENIVNGIWE